MTAADGAGRLHAIQPKEAEDIMLRRRSLILVTGEEGAGKTTVMQALLPQLPNAAKLDAEDVGQVNPFTMDEPFVRLLWDNVLAVITNFWAAGYPTVVTGSFLVEDSSARYRQFRSELPDGIDVYLVHLHASKAVRDRRRIDRSKPSTKEWRDRVDAIYPDDTDLRNADSDYRYIRIDNDTQSVSGTISAIRMAIPELFGSRSESG